MLFFFAINTIISFVGVFKSNLLCKVKHSSNLQRSTLLNSSRTLVKSKCSIGLKIVDPLYLSTVERHNSTDQSAVMTNEPARPIQ